jgi:hypothetical protein
MTVDFMSRVLSKEKRGEMPLSEEGDEKSVLSVLSVFSPTPPPSRRWM